MRGLVLWLFADLIFRLNNFIETIGFLLSLALASNGHCRAGSFPKSRFAVAPGLPRAYSLTCLRSLRRTFVASVSWKVLPQAEKLRAEGLGATEIAKRLNIGRASVYRVLAS